jgi:hypothetical protein
MLPSERKSLVQLLRAELSAIQKAIKEQEHAVHAASEAANEERRKIPRAISSIGVTPDEKTAEKTQRYKEYRQQVHLKWGTWFAFGAAIVYAGVAAYQAGLMNRTYNEIQKQTAAAQSAAKAAQEQATLMRQQLVGTQAAVLFLQPWGINSDGTGKITFLNRGAVFGHVSGNIEVARLLGREKYTLTKTQFSNLLIPPYTRSDVPPPPPVRYSVIGMKHGFTVPEIKAIDTDTPMPVLIMQVSWSYDNGFGDVGSRKACYSMFTTVPRLPPMEVNTLVGEALSHATSGIQDDTNIPTP